MRPDILILGQGLAGTLLGWEFERAGIPFAIADSVVDATASRVAAGLVNPITGRRFVPSWRIETLLPAARGTYREIETALGVSLWRELRIRRFFQDERERRIFGEKAARGELSPYLGAAESDGFWLEGAARVDVGRLLTGARTHWQRRGLWRDACIEPLAEIANHELVIDCRGLASVDDPAWAGVPWEFSKGEVLSVAVDGLVPDVVLHCGQWVLPTGAGEALVGSTHEPGVRDTTPTSIARATLAASAESLLGKAITITGHAAGVRVNVPDKRPVVGRHPLYSRLGLINALGAKGVLLAPWLARQWVNHVTEGVPFADEVALARFGRA